MPQPRARVLTAFCSLGTGTGGAAGGTGSRFGAGRRDHLPLAVARGDAKATFPSANADSVGAADNIGGNCSGNKLFALCARPCCVYRQLFRSSCADHELQQGKRKTQKYFRSLKISSQLGWCAGCFAGPCVPGWSQSSSAALGRCRWVEGGVGGSWGAPSCSRTGRVLQGARGAELPRARSGSCPSGTGGAFTTAGSLWGASPLPAGRWWGHGAVRWAGRQGRTCFSG